MDRIISGIKELDRTFDGLEAGQVFFLTGGTGTGKTALSMMFLAEGLKRGEAVLLVTSDFPEDIFNFAQDFLEMDLMSYLDEGKLILLEYPLVLEKYRNPVLGFDVDDIFNELRKHCDDISATRVVIDSLSPFLGFSANRDPLEFGRATVLGLKSLGATTLVTGDVEGEPGFKEVYNALERLAHGVFELKMAADGGVSLVRSLQVRKLKNELLEKSNFYFTLRSGEGVVFVEKPPQPAMEKVPGPPARPEILAEVPFFTESLTKELERATRYNRPLSLVILSLENFKLGRGQRMTPQNQTVIDNFNRVLSETGRDSDVISRYSWDRFIALLPETSAPNAVRFVHRVAGNLEGALRKQGLYEGQEIPQINHGVGEHPTDTLEGEDLVAAALRRLR
ncbi:MAG: ATPase domain-containing protein [Thermodesulfobacteriota bacterium]